MRLNRTLARGLPSGICALRASISHPGPDPARLPLASRSPPWPAPGTSGPLEKPDPAAQTIAAGGDPPKRRASAPKHSFDALCSQIARDSPQERVEAVKRLYLPDSAPRRPHGIAASEGSPANRPDLQRRWSRSHREYFSRTWTWPRKASFSATPSGDRAAAQHCCGRAAANGKRSRPALELSWPRACVCSAPARTASLAEYVPWLGGERAGREERRVALYESDLSPSDGLGNRGTPLAVGCGVKRPRAVRVRVMRLHLGRVCSLGAEGGANSTPELLAATHSVASVRNHAITTSSAGDRVAGVVARPHDVAPVPPKRRSLPAPP